MLPKLKAVVPHNSSTREPQHNPKVAQTLHISGIAATGQKKGFAHQPGIRDLISAETCTQSEDGSLQPESRTPGKGGGAGGGGGAASALTGRARKPGGLGTEMGWHP